MIVILFSKSNIEKKVWKYKANHRTQRLINLEIPVIVQSLKSSNVEFG